MAQPPLTSSFKQSNGTMYIAQFEAIALWSVLCLQTFMYFSNYPKDRFVLKAMVFWTLLLATVHIIMIITETYDIYITHFGDFSTQGKVSPLILFLLLPTTLIALTVQSFFIWRIWIFSGKKYILPSILAFAELFQLAGNIFTLYEGSHIQALSQLFAVDHVMLAYYAVTAAADLTISICMIYLLSHRRSFDGSEGSRRTTRILHRLIVISINSGLWTAIFAIGVLILSIIYDGKLVYSIMYFPLAHLYANSLLGNLNARNYVSGQSTKRSVATTSTGADIFQLEPVPLDSGATRVFVNTHVVKNVDNERGTRSNEWK